MFGRRGKHDGAGDGSTTASLDPPSTEERNHVLTSGKAFVGLIAAATSSPQDDDTTVWHLDVTYADGAKQREVRFADRVASRFQLAPGAHVPIRLGSVTIIDDVHLDRRMSEERSRGVAPSVKRWTLPALCPNCGAPVDQAVESVLPDPRCRFCEEPLPVQ